MWVNKDLFYTILADNKAMQEQVLFERSGASRMSAYAKTVGEQNVKHEMTIDWMRHRINALEKERTVLLQSVAGITLPTPEIARSEPRSVAAPQFGMAFEDMGDAEAKKQHIGHDEGGNVEYDLDQKRA
jgi:hypothetical protein